MTKKVVYVRFESGHEQYVQCSYNASRSRTGKKYAYFTDIDAIEAGDTVVVDTPSAGLALVTVTGVTGVLSEIAASGATKWIVDKVDVAAHKRRASERARRAAIEKRLAQLVEEQLVKDKWKLLAKVSDEAKLLLAELEGVNDEA